LNLHSGRPRQEIADNLGKFGLVGPNTTGCQGQPLDWICPPLAVNFFPTKTTWRFVKIFSSPVLFTSRHGNFAGAITECFPQSRCDRQPDSGGPRGFLPTPRENSKCRGTTPEKVRKRFAAEKLLGQDGFFAIVLLPPTITWHSTHAQLPKMSALTARGFRSNLAGVIFQAAQNVIAYAGPPTP